MQLPPTRKSALTPRLWLPLLSLACGQGDGNDTSAAKLTGAAFCERASSLAALSGCTTPLPRCEEPVSAQCTALGNTWLDCAATDRRQCICESDGDLNCEGSYKPNEGPAHCIDQMAQFDACTSQNGG